MQGIYPNALGSYSYGGLAGGIRRAIDDDKRRAARGNDGTGVNMNGVGRNGTVYSLDGTNASGNSGSNNPGTYQGGNLVDVMSADGIQEGCVLLTFTINVAAIPKMANPIRATAKNRGMSSGA